jgi:hypothetical protein
MVRLSPSVALFGVVLAAHEGGVGELGAAAFAVRADMVKHGNLNLDPGFQRQSVWNERDRAKLIESILRNYPLPAIFLYKRQEDGVLVYDVIDGKQRLES